MVLNAPVQPFLDRPFSLRTQFFSNIKRGTFKGIIIMIFYTEKEKGKERKNTIVGREM